MINNATQDAPTEQYRPAPEYGAYGPVPTPPAGDASGQTVQQPQYGAQQQGQPQDNRPSFFGAFGNPYTTGNQRNNGNPFGNPFGGSSAQNGAQQNNQQQPQYGANMPLRDRATAIRSALRGRASRTSRTRRRSSPSRSPA